MNNLNSEPLRMDRAANQELTELDTRILEVTTLIQNLERDLAKETNIERAKAIKSILDKEKANKDKLLDEKFTTAKPAEEPKAAEEIDAFSDAVGREHGGAINKMEKRAGF